MYIAADTLGRMVSSERLAKGSCYPPLDDIRKASTKIAAAIAMNIIRTGRADYIPKGINTIDEMEKYCETLMYKPTY